MNDLEKIDLLLRHINNVRENCQILGEKLISDGKPEIGRQLIANSQIHDFSKFSGVEWQFLVDPSVTNRAGLKYAVEHHNSTNPHHAEYWGSIAKVPDIFLYEMVADWKARAMEFGSSLREYIDTKATKRYGFIKDSPMYIKIMEIVDILCPKPFEPVEQSVEPQNEQGPIPQIKPV